MRTLNKRICIGLLAATLLQLRAADGRRLRSGILAERTEPSQDVTAYPSGVAR
jgi:hypothetical protein